jgi:uncharacterized alkaline shock family protein YloU
MLYSFRRAVYYGFFTEGENMRMKVSTRIIFTIYLVVIALLCLFLLATIFGLLPAVLLTQVTDTIVGGGFWFQLLYVCIFGVLLVVGVCLLFFGIKKEQPKTAVVASFENGKISIAISALEELAAKFVKQTGAVKGVGIKVTPVGEGVDVDVKINILPDVSIPQITQELQTGLISYIETYSGIKVSQAVVMVSSIDETIKMNNKLSGGN